MAKLQQSEDFNYHPSQDTTNRYALDILLRKYGFKIHSRRKNNEPIWLHGNKLFTQRDALRTVPRKELREACKESRQYQRYLKLIYKEDEVA